MADINGNRTRSTCTSNEEAERLRQCITADETIQQELNRLRAEQLRGDAIQDEINAIYDRMPGLQHLATLEQQGRVEERLSELQEKDALSTSEREAIQTLWNSISWIVDGVDAYAAVRHNSPLAWTDKRLQFTTRGDDLVAEHELNWGVDRIHHLYIPVDEFIADTIDRLRAINTILPTAVEEGYLDEQFLHDGSTSTGEHCLCANLQLEQLPEHGYEGSDCPE